MRLFRRLEGTVRAVDPADHSASSVRRRWILRSVLLSTLCAVAACSFRDDRKEAGRLFVAAMQLSRDGDTEKALKLLDEAQELDPSRIALYEQAAAMRHARGDLEGALAEVDAGLRQRSDHWGLLDLRGDVLRDLGRDKEAIESYRMCVSNMNPTGYWAPWLKLGQLQEKMGATSEARATYQEVLRVYPGSQEAQRRLSALDGG